MPPGLSALCPKARPGEIVVCADQDPPRSIYRLPPNLPPVEGSKESISVSSERNRLFDYDGGGTGSCSTSGAGGASGCLFNRHKRGFDQRAGAKDPRGNLYDVPPY